MADEVEVGDKHDKKAVERIKSGRMGGELYKLLYYVFKVEPEEWKERYGEE